MTVVSGSIRTGRSLLSRGCILVIRCVVLLLRWVLTVLSRCRDSDLLLLSISVSISYGVARRLCVRLSSVGGTLVVTEFVVMQLLCVGPVIREEMAWGLSVSDWLVVGSGGGGTVGNVTLVLVKFTDSLVCVVVRPSLVIAFEVSVILSRPSLFGLKFGRIWWTWLRTGGRAVNRVEQLMLLLNSTRSTLLVLRRASPELFREVVTPPSVLVTLLGRCANRMVDVLVRHLCRCDRLVPTRCLKNRLMQLIMSSLSVTSRTVLVPWPPLLCTCSSIL